MSLLSTLTLPVAPVPMDPVFEKQANTCFTYTNDSIGISDQWPLAVRCVFLSLALHLLTLLADEDDLQQ